MNNRIFETNVDAFHLVDDLRQEITKVGEVESSRFNSLSDRGT